MLRRKPTRIELRRDDLEEYEKAKKTWIKDAKKQEEVKIDDTPVGLNDPRRITKIHERIGYNPQTVPSDGTTTLVP